MEAIAIEVNGTFLDLTERSLRLEVVNAAFDSSVFQGDYSFPFDIPATAKNLMVLGNPSFVDAGFLNEKFDAQVYVFGLPKYLLTLSVTKANKKRISIVLNGGLKALRNADKKLSEIAWPADILLGNTSSSCAAKAKQITLANNWQTYGIAFVPFYAPDFYNGQNPFWGNVCNKQDSTTGGFLSNVSTNNANLVPWLYLHFVLYTIFKENGLTISGDYWSNEEFATILLVCNKSYDILGDNYNTKVIQDYTSPGTVYNATGQVVGLDLGPSGTFDNAFGWDNATDEYVIKMAGTYTFDFAYLLKVNSSASIVTRPFQLDAGAIEFYFDGALVASNDITAQLSLDIKEEQNSIKWQFTAVSGDVGKAFQIKFKKGTGINQGPTYINLLEASLNITNSQSGILSRPEMAVKFSDIAPDTTVGNFLAELKKFGLDYNFSQPGQVIINTVDKQLRESNVIDLSTQAGEPSDVNYDHIGKGYKIGYQFTNVDNASLGLEASKFEGETWIHEDLPLPSVEGNWRIITSTNEIYKVVTNSSNVNEWQFAGYNYDAYQIGAGEQNNTPAIAPVQMVIATNAGGTSLQNAALMPRYFGKGSTDLYGLGKTNPPLNICFYRGENQLGPRTDDRGGVYFYAGTGQYGVNGNIVGNYTFRLDTRANIIRSNTEIFLEKRNSNPIVEFEAATTATIANSITGSSKMIIDNNVYLVKSLSVFFKRSVAAIKAYVLKV